MNTMRDLINLFERQTQERLVWHITRGRYDHITEASPDDRLRGLALYHGTSTTVAAESVLRHGLKPDQKTIYKGDLRPAKGAVYLSADEHYAIKYALGPDARKRSPAEYKDRYCYLFVVRGADLEDVTPDEDSIGEFMWLNTIPNPGGNGKAKWQFDAVRSDDPAKQEVWNWLFAQAKPAELNGCCTLGPTRPAAWAAFGKRLHTMLPDWISLKLIEWGAHIAHIGTIHPSECWRLNRDHQHEVARNTTEFFNLAERLR